MANKAISPNHREAITAISSITGLDEYITSTNGAIDINGTIGGSPLPISGATTGVGVAILDGSGNQITSFGGGTQYTTGSAQATPTGTVSLGWDGTDVKALPLDASGFLKVNVAAGGGSGGTSSSFSAAFPATGTAIGATDGTNMQPLKVDASKNLLTSINTALPAGTNAIGSITNTAFGATQSGTWNITNISGTVSLPTGAATAANQTNASQKTQIVDGSGNVIASTSNALNTLIPDTTATGSITSTQSVTLANNGLATAAVQVTGTWTGTLAVEGSVDGTNYNSTTAAFLANGQLVSNITSNAIYQVNLSGLSSFRIRGNTIASGTAVVTIRGNATSAMVMLDNPIPAGSAAIGSVTATQGTATNLKTQAESYQGGTAVGSSNPLQVTLANTGANTTAVKVDGSAVTQPISGTVTANAGTGTFNIQSNASVNLSQVAGASTATGHGTASGSLRVELPTDGTGVVGLNAGSNLVGKVGIDQTTNGTTNAVVTVPATSGGLSFTSASVGATATSIKASAGQLYGYHLFNTTAAVAYVQIFNVASGSVTVGTTTPDLSIGIPASGGVTVNFDKGIAFSTAISFACTTTRTGSSGATCDVNFFYK